MSKTRDTGFLGNVVKYDANGNISLVSGSTTLMYISSSGAITTTGVISGSNVLTASYANNAETLDGLDSTVFTLTSSFNTTSASLYTVSSSAYATSGSLSATSGSLSAASGSLSAASGSFNTRVTALEVTGSALSSSILSVSASSYSTSGSLSSASGSFNTRISTVESKYATTGSNTFRAPQYVSDTTVPSGFANSTGSIYTDGGLLVAKDSYFSGSMFIKGNLTIYGTQSVAYITSSQLNIATNLITVNTATPSVRFGGLAVYDSGSTGTGMTGSLLWDSQNNSWIYDNPSGSGNYDSAMVIMGPRNASSLGSEQGLNCNYLVQGHGHHHTTSSQIYHDSTVTCVGTGTSITSTGDSCFANNVCALNLVSRCNIRVGVNGGYAVISGPTTGAAISLGSNSSTFDRNLSLGIVGGDLSFSPILTINAQTGNVGIGMCTPDRRLYITDTSVTQGTFLAYNQCTTFCGTVIEGITDRTSSSAFNLMNLKSSTTPMFTVRGDGQVCAPNYVSTNCYLFSYSTSTVRSIWGGGYGGVVQLTSDNSTTARYARIGISDSTNVWQGGMTIAGSDLSANFSGIGNFNDSISVAASTGGSSTFWGALCVSNNKCAYFSGVSTFLTDITGKGAFNGYAGATQNLLIDWSAESQVTTLTNTNLFFGTNAQRRMTINGLGRVGIGLSSPTAFLHVCGNNCGSDISCGAGNPDARGIIHAQLSNAVQSANASVTVENNAGIGQFMQWDQFGMRIGSRIIKSTTCGNIYFTVGQDNNTFTLFCSGISCFAGKICAPTYNFTGASNSCIYADASYTYFVTSNANRFNIDVSGIGTFACNICVGKYIHVGTQGGSDIVFLGGGSGVGATIEARYADGNPNVHFAGNGNSWINRSYGQVGIGTCTPNYMLDVNGAINSSAGTIYSNGVVKYTVGGYMQGYTATYFDFPTWDDTSQGQMLEIKAFFDHFYNWNYGAHYYIYLTSRETNTQYITMFNCPTSNGGSWMAYKTSSTNLRVCKVAGSYSGGGAYWIQVTSKQP